MIVSRQLSWIGHIIRIYDDRLPKQLLCSELATGKHSVGGQKRRYKDQLKAKLEKCNIQLSELETLASNRRLLHSTICQGVQVFEQGCTDARI